MVVRVGQSCRPQQPQRALFVPPGVTHHLQQHLGRSREGRHFTYLLPEFLCLFVLFPSWEEEEEEEGGASTRSGLATSEPQRQKPFPCSINFIGKSVSLGAGVGVPRERAAQTAAPRSDESLQAGRGDTD